MSQPETYKLTYLARRAKTVAREDWARTWRNHAVFASQFPALESTLLYLRYCNRVDAPAIDGTPVDLPQLSTAHDGVAVAAAPSLSAIQGGGFSPEDQARIDTDERRVFDMLTPNFTYFSTETIAKPGPLGKAALFRFLPRAEGLSREQFGAWFRGELAQDIAVSAGSIAGMTRAVLNSPVHDPLPLFAFDGIAEFWFDTVDDAVRALAEGKFAEIDRAVAGCSASEGADTLLTQVSHRWSDL